MTDAGQGVHVSVIYDVPELRPVPLPDMICASPADVAGPYRAVPSRLFAQAAGHRPRADILHRLVTVGVPPANRVKPGHLREPVACHPAGLKWERFPTNPHITGKCKEIAKE
jgi:hypothetical protein